MPENLQETCSAKKNIQENTKYPETEGLWWEKDQNYKRKYRGHQIIKPKKCTKSDQRNLKQLKISINIERNLRGNESYCHY